MAGDAGRTQDRRHPLETAAAAAAAELSPFTSDDIILLARNPSATLPESFSSSALLPLLHSPSPALLHSLVSLVSRSPPSPAIVSPLLLSFLRLFFSHRLPGDPNTSRAFHLLFPLLPHLDTSNIPSLLDLLSSHLSDISNADEAQALDLLPHLLGLAAADADVINTFLEKLLSIEWSKALLVKMCSLIRDCPPITRVRVSDFLQKIFAGMRDVDIQDLPSLVFQLLLLASKGISSVARKQLITDLLRFFGEPMKGSAAVVRQVEGTVLMHVNFAVKQDPSLGSVVISVVRSDLGTFNHFAAAILLSVARIRRFNDSSIGALKSVVVGSYQDLKLARDCKWLPDITKEELLRTAKRIEKALVRSINESSCGREHVVPSILQFGFILLESVDGKSCEASNTSDGLMGCEEIGIQTLKTLFEVHEMARNQGGQDRNRETTTRFSARSGLPPSIPPSLPLIRRTRLMTKTKRCSTAPCRHPHHRSQQTKFRRSIASIFQPIFDPCKRSRLMPLQFNAAVWLSIEPPTPPTYSSGPPETESLTNCCRLQALFRQSIQGIQNYPYPMLEYVARLKELLDYFTFMHDNTAVSLINAILPLIKFSKELQDYIILVIRKALFRREDNVRTAAASTIMDLIIAENRSKRNDLNSLQDSSSQASCSQQAGIYFRTEGCLFQELNGLLKRCLAQQVTVKEIVYKGLTRLVMSDPAISQPVFDFLWPHFLQFYGQDAKYPLRIDVCLVMENGKVSQFEPLDQLLSSVSWLLLLQQHGRSDHQSDYSLPCFGFNISQDNEAGRLSSRELFLNALSDIRKSLSKWIFEVCFKQSEDSTSHSFQGEKSGIYGCLLLGILEVFINMAVTELEKAEHEGEVALQKEIMWLVDSYDHVEKESGLNKAGSSIGKGSSNTIAQHKVDHDLKDSPRISQSKMIPVRGSLLATSSILKLLNLAVNSYNASCVMSKSTLNHTQSSLPKKTVQCSKMTSFSLKVCCHHLKSMISTSGGSNDDPYKAIIYGDPKQLALPIMQLVWLLKSGVKEESLTKKTDVKGKNKSESKADELHLALLCLNELFKISPSKAYLSELIEVLDTLEAAKFNLGNTVENTDGIIDEQPVMVGDPYGRRFQAFLNRRVKPLYSMLIDLSLFQEAVVVSELFLIIWRTMPFEQRKIYGMWMMNACKNRKIVNPKLAQNMISLALHLKPSPGDLTAAQDIASELLQVIGSEEKDPVDISRTYPFVNSSTKGAVAAALFHVIESCLVDLDWSVSKLKSVSVFKHEFDQPTRNHQIPERLPGVIFEEAVHSRSEALVSVLSFFADMNLKDSQAEQFLKMAAKFYKILSRMTKIGIAPKGCKQLLPGLEFQRLAEVACRKLTCKLYNFVALVQRNQQENISSRGTINKIKRENRCIPDLIFHIEDYERYLIQLSKLTKVNLLRNAKRSTVRDFKILEMKKTSPPGEETECEPAPISSNSSEDKSGNESEEHEEDNASQRAESPVSIFDDGAVEDSESDKDVHLVRKNKRAKMSKVVQESQDDEA
ncbi:hypothetical protein KSP40_PGU004403 [Platanthera guangdongensis]|uniref:Fanconi anemia group I protein n=1 Tax=Platanthera guangdongensis TaxID=2320717 RepID=A0ABR2M9T2_9ASPA